MWMFKMRDGKVKEAPKSFDQNNPDVESLEGVEEVYPIKQILVPRLKLVPKPAEEVKAIREKKTKAEERATKKALKNVDK